MQYNILIVDDEKYTLEDIELSLDKKQLHIHNIYTSLNITNAKKILETEQIHILITDIDMPGGNGLELIKYIRQYRPKMPCVLITCHADFFYAQEAIRLKCYDYILKPIDYDALTQQLLKIEATIANAINDSTKYESYQDIRDVLVKRHPSAQNIQLNYIDNAVAYISDNLTNNICREDVANHVHLTPDHLDKLFREQLNMSVYKYITCKKIALAEELLLNTELSISDISSDLGFSNMSNFAFAFKKANAMTPNDYRKKHKGK